MDAVAATEVCKSTARTKYGLDECEVLQIVDELQSRYSFDGLFYGAVLESNPDLLDSIYARFMTSNSVLFGNSSDSLRQCKNPEKFFSTLDQNSIPYPETSFKLIANSSGPWLLKHATSTGGLGVSGNQVYSDVNKDSYYQRKIDGLNFSLLFLANGKEIKALGFNSLWSERLGEKFPYAYSGAINSVELTEEQQSIAIRYATIITKAFNLIGLNSIDYILSNNNIYVLEVNPRIPATYELYETKHGDLLKEHIDVCITHELAPSQPSHLLRAHAIVYAQENVQIPKDFVWPLWTADRPYPEQWVQQYDPVCSVFSGGKNVVQVRQMIHTRKKIILESLNSQINDKRSKVKHV